MSKEIWKVYGNENPEILIAGHSHVFPMYMAVMQRPQFQTYFGVASQTDFSIPQERDLSYWEFVAKRSKNKTVAILWNGNQHNIHFLIDTEEPFRVFGLLPGPEDVPTVALSRIKKLFEPTMEELRIILKLFKKSSKIILVQTPPPKSKKFLDSRLLHDSYFLSVAKQLEIPRKSLHASSDQLRLAMWRVTQEMTREISIEFNYEYFDLPNETVDSSGLLSEKYWTEDLSHANEDFGAKWMDEFLKFRGANFESTSI